MRFVKRDLDDVPQALKIVINQNEWADVEKNKNLIDDKIYKGEYKDREGKMQSSVREHLNKYYFEKCAYCEIICKAEIEHYRPKKAVKEDKNHPGYYWLCYQWSNLLPSCRYCNTEGGKGNQFPIRENGVRVSNPLFNNNILDNEACVFHNSPLKAELPYLLHPEADDPKKYFRFKINAEKGGIKIYGVDDEERGMWTINICNLNKKPLMLHRLEDVYYTISQRINLIFDCLAQGVLEEANLLKALKLVFNQLIEEADDPKLQHTLLRWYLVDTPQNFENNFIPFLKNQKQQLIVKVAFEKYKNNSL